MLMVSRLVIVSKRPLLSLKYYEVISEQIEESERLIIDTSHLKIELNQTSFGKEDLLNLENVYLKMKHMMNEIQNATDK